MSWEGAQTVCEINGRHIAYGDLNLSPGNCILRFLAPLVATSLATQVAGVDGERRINR